MAGATNPGEFDFARYYRSKGCLLYTSFDEEGAVPLRDVEGEITFKHVSFEYPDDHTPVLSDINLTIKPGEKVALVGPSGGGKTTLCNLIPRFYDPTEGEILLDGQNIRNVTLESLRSNVGVVQQDVYLFSGSVYENIAYGKPGATREEVVRAAKMAGAHEFIEGLKDGYDTYVCLLYTSLPHCYRWAQYDRK